MPKPKFWIDWERKAQQRKLEQELYKRIDQEKELEKRRNNPPSEKPLEQEHPAMDVALMCAQPGGWLAKAMAPGAYKALIDAVASGNTEDLLYSATPAGKTKFATKTLENEMKAAANKGVRDANAFVKDPAVQASIQRNADWFARQQALGQTQIQWPATTAEGFSARTTVSPKIELADLGASNGQGSYARIVQNGSERFIFVPQTIRSGQSNKIKINKGLPIENVASTAFHERLHTLGYGDVGSNPFNKAIAEKMLISPKSAPRELQLGLNYLGDSNEIAAWLAQSGKELNLKPGAKYIGREQLENLIETSPRLKQLRPYLNLNSDADFKRLWRGLTGTLFGSTLVIENYGGSGQE